MGHGAGVRGDSAALPLHVTRHMPGPLSRARQLGPVQYRDRNGRVWYASQVAQLKIVSPSIDGPNRFLVIRFEREGEERFVRWLGGEEWSGKQTLHRLFAESEGVVRSRCDPRLFSSRAEPNADASRRDPGAVGIETRDGGRDRLRLGAEVLLVQHAVLTDGERHDAAHAVVGGPRDQGKPATHRTVRHVRARSTGCIRSRAVSTLK